MFTFYLQRISCSTVKMTYGHADRQKDALQAEADWAAWQPGRWAGWFAGQVGRHVKC